MREHFLRKIKLREISRSTVIDRSHASYKVPFLKLLEVMRRKGMAELFSTNQGKKEDTIGQVIFVVENIRGCTIPMISEIIHRLNFD